MTTDHVVDVLAFVVVIVNGAIGLVTKWHVSQVRSSLSRSSEPPADPPPPAAAGPSKGRTHVPG